MAKYSLAKRLPSASKFCAMYPMIPRTITIWTIQMTSMTSIDLRPGRRSTSVTPFGPIVLAGRLVGLRRTRRRGLDAR